MSLSSLILRCFRWGIPVLLGLVAVLIAWLSAQQLEWGVFDAYSRWAAKQDQQPSPVRLVLIDDTSIDKLKERYGLPPWPRKAYIEIFRDVQAYQPAVTVFDGHFMYFQREDDRQNFDSLKQIPHLILGMVYQPDQSSLASQWLKEQARNYYLLNLGVVNIQQDPKDGILRAIHPVWMPSEHTPGVFPALSLAAALDYRRQQQSDAAWVLDWKQTPYTALSLFSETTPSRSLDFPLQEDGSLLLHWKKLLPETALQKSGFYQGGLDVSHTAIPLWQVLSPQTLSQKQAIQKALKGKIVLLGAASSLHQDFHHTPLSIHQAGADIQATAIDNFLEQSNIREAPEWFGIFISLVALVGIILLRLWIHKPEHCLLYTLGSMVIYGWIAFWAFYRLHLWLPVVTPELMMALGFLIATLGLSLLQNKEVALLEGHLSRLVSQSVFQEIRRMSRIITQGGRKLEITAMMVDIRNFTSLAETLSPQQVSGLLNEFYEVVVDVVFAHRGTVDKFLGDGVMILFGAPIPDNRHAQDGISAALALIEKSQVLTKRWQQERGIETEIGISLHSGSAFVGFIGPKNKLEYTAIGDTINLCARLQEQAKALQSKLVVSQNTIQESGYTPASDRNNTHLSPFPRENGPLSDGLEKLSLHGPVTVRGRETPIVIWIIPSNSA